MIKKVLAMVAVALTALLLLPPDPADARRGGGFRGGGFGGGFRAAGGFRGGGFRAAPAFRAGPSFRAGPAFRVRTFAPRPVYAARPVYFRRPIVRRVGPVFIAGGGGCEWLRQRAIFTGSPYWWRRYYLCRGY